MLKILLIFALLFSEGTMIPGVIKVHCLGAIFHISEVYEVPSSPISKNRLYIFVNPPNRIQIFLNSFSILAFHFLPTPFSFFLHYAVAERTKNFLRYSRVNQAIPAWSISEVHILVPNRPLNMGLLVYFLVVTFGESLGKGVSCCTLWMCWMYG